MMMNDKPQYVRFDWAMKRLLRDKANYGVLEGLISTLLNKPIRIQRLLESESNQEDKDDKYNRVDILAEDDKGNGDISHVSAIHIRAMDFEPFAFRINDKALPELIEGYKPETKKPGRPEEEKFDPYRHITEQQHRIALEAVFGLKEEYGYKELEDALIKTYMSVGVKLNHKKAVSLITMLRNKRMIVQETGRKYTFMPDFHY